ncbi:MAG: isocitrate lyase/phosphoenolpyruvate mutase family protein [Solirubrobacteraceae bacterium]
MTRPSKSPDRGALAEQAERLLRAHHEDTPVLLANVWDASSARAVEAAGFEFVATSSRAVAQVLGEPDDDSSDPDLIFSFTARIARAVSVPVTADLEAGFGLAPSDLVSRLLEAGVVGCNLEDTDHHADGVLLDADRQAAYLAEVRAASEQMGVHVVLNTRTDTFIRLVGDEAAQLEEAIRRGRLYLEAGADCVYPIAVASKDHVASLIASVPGPLNFLARRGGLSIDDLAGLGARRISLASGVFHLVAERLGDILSALASGAGFDDL